jgi:hypothetical protein
MNVAIIIASLFLAKKAFQIVKNMMKNSGGQNMFDMDNKKIEAIKP